MIRLIQGREVIQDVVHPKPLALVPTIVRSVTIVAFPTNEGIIYLGGQNVSSQPDFETGYRFRQNDQREFSSGLIDLSQIWIAANTAGEGVMWGAEIDISP